MFKISNLFSTKILLQVYKYFLFISIVYGFLKMPHMVYKMSLEIYKDD